MRSKAMQMGVSPIPCFRDSVNHRLRMAGLTLIEVLIALAIMSIAITAIIKATTQNIRGTAYLQNKTIATWVGKQIVNEVRLGLVSLPLSSDGVQEKTTMLGRDWYWRANRQPTSNKRINKIEVSVSESENEEVTPIMTLESYVYLETAS